MECFPSIATIATYLNFSEMGITPGCVLNAIEGEESDTVVNDRKVSFRDQTMSLTCATRVCRDFSYNVNPYPYWLYSGCRLSDKYEETYLLDDQPAVISLLVVNNVIKIGNENSSRKDQLIVFRSLFNTNQKL